MAGKRRSKGTPSWKTFLQRYGRHPFLKIDPLYALPGQLVALLDDFFSKEEAAFEMELAQAVSGGFVGGCPFDEVLLEAPDAEDLASTTKDLQELRADELKEQGLNPLQIDSYFKAEAKQQQYAQLRAGAYAGWLIANPLFRAERDALRKKCGALVEGGRFPRLAQEPAAPEPFLSFYRRWALEAFITWDLPQPLGPALHGLTMHDNFTLSKAGVNIFLPWYFLRDRRFSLAEVADHLRTWENPTHLKDWFSSTTSDAGLGYTRWYNLLVLYRYHQLALVSRYAERLKGNVERIDRAFAEFLSLSSVDSVKKLRLELQHRLRRSSPPTS